MIGEIALITGFRAAQRPDAGPDAALEALALLERAAADHLEGRTDRWPEFLLRAREIEARADLRPEEQTMARLARELIEAGPESENGLRGFLDRLREEP